MTSELVLSRVKGRTKRDDSWEIEDISEQVEVVKVVGGIFIHTYGESDCWVEIILGNSSDFPVQITDIEFEITDLVGDVKLAPSGHTDRSDNGDGYLWGEEENGWTSMYEDYARVPENSGYFRTSSHSTTHSDQIFMHTLGEGETEERAITTPTWFQPRSEERQDSHAVVCNLRDLRPLDSDGEPVLLDNDTVEQQISEDEEYRKYVDSISLWVKWDSKNLTNYRGDGSFRSRLIVRSEIGQISHLYFYYTLPPEGDWEVSQSPVDIDSWGPGRERHFFDEWKSRYDIQTAGTAGTSRMLRGSARGVNEAKSNVEFNIKGLGSLSTGTEQVFTAAIVIGATLMIQNYYFSSPSDSRLVLTLLGVLVMFATLIMIHVYPGTDSVTWNLYRFRKRRKNT